MSIEGDIRTDSASDNDPLRARMDQLQAELTRSREEATRRRKTTVIVAALLMVCSLFALGRASTLVQMLDPGMVAELGRLEVENQLPGTRAMVGEYLVEQAPSIVSGILDSLVDTLPGMRAAIEKSLFKQIDSATRDFEKQLVGELKLHVQRQRERIDAATPDMSDTDKLRALTDAVTGEFNRVFEVTVDHLYPKFAKKLDEVESQLDSLAQDDREQMTPHERAQAEIVEIMLALMMREGN